MGLDTQKTLPTQPVKPEINYTQEIAEMLADSKLTKEERTRLEEIYRNLDNVSSEANEELKKFLKTAQGGPDFEKFKGNLLGKINLKQNGNIESTHPEAFTFSDLATPTPYTPSKKIELGGINDTSDVNIIGNKKIEIKGINDTVNQKVEK